MPAAIWTSHFAFEIFALRILSLMDTARADLMTGGWNGDGQAEENKNRKARMLVAAIAVVRLRFLRLKALQLPLAFVRPWAPAGETAENGWKMPQTSQTAGRAKVVKKAGPPDHCTVRKIAKSAVKVLLDPFQPWPKFNLIGFEQ